MRSITWSSKALRVSGANKMFAGATDIGVAGVVAAAGAPVGVPGVADIAANVGGCAGGTGTRMSEGFFHVPTRDVPESRSAKCVWSTSIFLWLRSMMYPYLMKGFDCPQLLW